MRVVIGAGADAIRAGACLAQAGKSVLVLQECEQPSGLVHPSLPEGSGMLRVSEEMRPSVEAVTGPLTSKDTRRRAVAVGGSVLPLPLRITDVPRVFGREALPSVGQDFIERRVRNALVPLTGEGQEERTYRQWVERRMGHAAYLHAYADYAERRWGASGEGLAVGLARLHHNPHGAPELVPAEGRHESMHAAAVGLIEANGGEVRVGVAVKGLKVEEGRVVAIRVGRRNIPVDGQVWVARPHSVVAEWLGDALGLGPRTDAAALKTLDRVQVAFEVEAALPVDEIHVLDKDAPAFRITQVFGSGFTAVFHANVEPGQPAPDPSLFLALGESLGLRLKGETARLERLKDWVPVWTPMIHTRLRRLALAYTALGVVMVGRRGSFSPIDLGTELAVAAHYARATVPDQREMLRTVFAPPVRDDDLDASFRDFLWR